MRRFCAVAAAVLAVAFGEMRVNQAHAQAASESTTTALSLPAGPLAESLRALSLQTGDPINFDPQLMANLQASALAGRYTAVRATAEAVDGKTAIDYSNFTGAGLSPADFRLAPMPASASSPTRATTAVVAA